MIQVKIELKVKQINLDITRAKLNEIKVKSNESINFFFPFFLLFTKFTGKIEKWKDNGEGVILFLNKGITHVEQPEI